MLRRVVITGVCLIASGAALDALAEVSVRNGRDGNYVGTRVIAPELQSTRSLWSVRGKAQPGLTLNPMGDRNGDLWPTIAESTLAPHYPWVVWSRFNGTDYDLAWSRWTGSAWSSIQTVEPQTENKLPRHDLDPAVAFDAQGRPYLVWWRDDPQGGTVLLSVFVGDTWRHAFAVSAAGVDGRYPTISVVAPGLLDVHYQTPAGTVRQFVAFQDPVTITDDINPQVELSLKGQPVFIRDARH